MRLGRVISILVSGLLCAMFSSASPASAISSTASGVSASDDSYGTITPAMQAEIDRVVAGGTPASLSASSPAALVAAAIRCATFDGERYCLHVGWTERSVNEVRAQVVEAMAKNALSVADATGAKNIRARILDHLSLDPTARSTRERQMLELAAKSVGKVIRLRHDVEGDSLPQDFTSSHPEVSEMVVPGGGLDERGAILSTSKVNEQNRTYWCGPGSMQMIHWNWGNNSRVSEQTWANRLNTTRSGTSIWQMVRVTNARTGWDREGRAGTYIVLDIGGYNFSQWFALNTRHYHDYRAPVILHPLLHKTWFPYLDDNGSGHFQVGRGWDYNLNDTAPKQISYFEPWNQQRFDRSEPYIKRVQWRRARNSYKANQAHSMHNIGV